jgi:hypothetical protein
LTELGDGNVHTPYRKPYAPPSIVSDKNLEIDALGSARTASPDPRSRHFYAAYDTWTGHLGPGFGVSASQVGSAGVGFGPGGTSQVYGYSGLRVNWVSLNT